MSTLNNYASKPQKTREKKHVIEVGSVWKSNSCGDFVILENLGLMTTPTNCYQMTYYRVKFLTSGKTYDLSRHQVVYGDFKDPYYPSKYNTGYLGDMSGNINNDPVAKRAYNTWDRMLSRCYNYKDPDYYNYGGKGVYVDPTWRNFTNFYNDIQSLPGFNEWKDSFDYSLDKDRMQFGQDNKVYSKETCQFILKSENTKLRHIESGIIPTSGYHGVQTKYSRYNIQMTIDGKTVHLGGFDNPEAAAVVYNYYASIYNRIPNTNVTMPLHEALTHRILPPGEYYKEMCRIVNKE